MMLFTTCLIQLPRGGSVLPNSMAQQGYGLASGPSRTSQYDDRAVGQSRQDCDDMGVAAAQPEVFGRSTPYVDGSSLFSASASSYDHTVTGLRADATSHSVLNMHSQPPGASQTLGSYSDALPHQQPHYTQYAQAPSQIGQSSQAYQHHQSQNQRQHHHQHHLHHPSDQHMGLPMGSDLVGSQSFGMPHSHSPYGLHAHPDYAQSSLEVQRKAQARAEPAEPHTPRPPNAWILYRSQKFKEIQQNCDAQSRSGSSEKPKSQAEISRIISQMWQSETTAVKQKFEALADEKKVAHQRMYPTYRYRPKKKAKSSKQSTAAQQNAKKQAAEGHGIKREAQGSLAGGHQDRYPSESSTSTTYSADRSKESHRPACSQTISGVHDLAGRELMSRKNNYGDRRERGELQIPVNYGRSVSGSISSGEGHSISSYSNRMHPYGDRPSTLMRQESPRASDVFGDSQASSSTYASSHWADSDAISASSSGTYFDGTRTGSTVYPSLGNARLPGASLISNALPSMLPLSPPQRQSVPSQQLQHPMDHMARNLTLAELTSTGGSAGYGNGGGSFRTTPLTSHTARFGASFGGEPRSELPSGLPVAGSNEGLSDSFDPNRRMQL